MVNNQNNLLIKKRGALKKRKLIIISGVVIIIVISIFVGIKALSVSGSSTDEIVMANMESNSSNENIVINYINKNGIETISGSKYSSSSIKEIENLKFSEGTSDEDSVFVGKITLSNGICYQAAKLSGKINYCEEDGGYILNNLYIEPESKVYKENNIDESRIKNVIIEEIVNGESYKFNDSEKVLYYTIDKNSITEFNINKYIVREDNTIRAEIEGVALGSDKEAICFSGYVSISGNPAEGNIENSKDIVIESVKKRMV